MTSGNDEQNSGPVPHFTTPPDYGTPRSPGSAAPAYPAYPSAQRQDPQAPSNYPSLPHAQTSAPARAATHKPLLIGLAAVAVVLVGVLVVGVVALLNRDDNSSSTTQSAGAQTSVEFAEQPTIQWQLPIADASAVSGAVFGSSEIYSTRPAALQFGDLIVLSVRNSAGAPTELIAVNTTTGQREWSVSGDVKVCGDQLLDGKLVCLDRTGSNMNYGTPADIVLHDMATGEVSARITPSLFVTGIDVVDDSIVTVGSHRDDRAASLIISNGTADDLQANWTRAYRTDDTGCTGSGDSTYFTADRSVIATGNGMLDFYVRTSDGEPLVGSGLAYTQYQPGARIVGRRCSSLSASEVYVYDLSGRLVRRHTPTVSGSPRLGTDGTTISPAPYLEAGTLLAFDDGAPIWGGTNPLSDYGPSFTAELIGDTVVVSGSTSTEDYATAGFSLADGTKLWSGSSVQITGRNSWLTDGTRLFCGGSGTLAALDLHTGEQAWSLTYGTDDNTATLYRVGDGMLVVTDTELTYVAET